MPTPSPSSALDFSARLSGSRPATARSEFSFASLSPIESIAECSSLPVSACPVTASTVALAGSSFQNADYCTPPPVFAPPTEFVRLDCAKRRIASTDPLAPRFAASFTLSIGLIETEHCFVLPAFAYWKKGSKYKPGSVVPNRHIAATVPCSGHFGLPTAIAPCPVLVLSVAHPRAAT